VLELSKPIDVSCSFSEDSKSSGRLALGGAENLNQEGTTRANKLGRILGHLPWRFRNSSGFGVADNLIRAGKPAPKTREKSGASPFGGIRTLKTSGGLALGGADNLTQGRSTRAKKPERTLGHLPMEVQNLKTLGWFTLRGAETPKP
jgi:hypothetical protein